jgi:hypothetical protein
MTADEARNIADAANYERIKSDINRVFNIIREYALKGEKVAVIPPSYFKNYEQRILLELSERGFDTSRDLHYHYVVSWW